MKEIWSSYFDLNEDFMERVMTKSMSVSSSNDDENLKASAMDKSLKKGNPFVYP